MADDREQSKRRRIAAEERQKTIEDNQILVNQAELLNKKLESHVQNSKKINDLRAELLDKLIESKDNLDEQNSIIHDYSKELRVQVDMRTNIGKDLMKEVELLEKARKAEEKRVELQDNLQSKADGMLDGLESQVRNIPLVGDILASTIDFGGLKKEMGGILKGVTQNFMSLKAGGMSTGAAISKSFGAAIPSIMSFGASLYAAVAPILPIILAIVAAMYVFKKAFQFSQDVADLSRELGIGNDESKEMMHNFQDMSASSSNLNVNVKSLVQAQKELSSAFGSNVQMSKEMLENQIALTKFYGMTGEEAAKFQQTAISLNSNTTDLKTEVAATVGGMNDMYNVGLSTGDVMKEIGSLSASNLATFKGNTKELVATVSIAKVLGTSIEKINEQADKTLDIESSLKAEAKARMMTGISINNNEIRLARLKGDTAGVLQAQLKELSKIENLEGMLPKQQEALAESMNMTQDELLELNNKQKLLNELGAENLDQLTLENVKRAGLNSEAAKEFIAQQEKLAASEKMDALMSKLEDTAMKLAAPLMDLLDPMMEMVDFILPAIGPLLKFAFAPIMLVANIVKGLAKIFKGDIAGGIHEIGAGILEFMYKPFVLVVDLVSGFFPSIGQAIESAFGNLKSLAADILPDWATKLLFGTDDKGNVSGTEYDSEGNVVDSINDGVITPNGDVVKTNPSDYIMAMKNPMDFISNIPTPFDMIGGALDGIGNMFGGGESVSIDYDRLAEAISKQPIVITVDGKVVSEITRVQSKQSSFRR
jgi:hypothetical protein